MTDLVTYCETWFDVKLVETWMRAQDIYALVIVCMSARKKAPVNLLMGTFELYMFIGVSMQLRVVLIPYCWSVALEKKSELELHEAHVPRANNVND